MLTRAGGTGGSRRSAATKGVFEDQAELLAKNAISLLVATMRLRPEGEKPQAIKADADISLCAFPARPGRGSNNIE